MRGRGITLIELLVVLVVVGILAAVALPAWRHYVQRVNRTDATAALYGVLSAQERFYLRQGRYTSNLTAAPPLGLGISGTSTAGRYQLSVELATDQQTFIARATPTPGGGQQGDTECRAFSLDHRGRRSVTGSRGVAHCWR